jgi:hypothetical protein
MWDLCNQRPGPINDPNFSMHSLAVGSFRNGQGIACHAGLGKIMEHDRDICFTPPKHPNCSSFHAILSGLVNPSKRRYTPSFLASAISFPGWQPWRV